MEEDDQDTLYLIREQVTKFLAIVSELTLPQDIELQIAMKMAELEVELKKDNVNIETVRGIANSMNEIIKET